MTHDDEQVARLRLAVMRLARRLRQQAEGDVTPSMLSALATLERTGGTTLGALAEAEGVRPPTMTRIVTRLEEGGLVARTTDPEDRRSIRLQLTGDGRRFIKRNRSRKDAYLAARLRRLGPDSAGVERVAELIERLLEEDD